MKNSLILITIFLIGILPLNVYAEIKKGKWEFVKDEEYCFIQSAPIKTEIPNGKKRGENYILVYKVHHSPEQIIQITAGYDYNSIDSISVKVDDSEYEFYTDADTAWAKDDKKIIYAMKKGLDLVITGTSSKGTKVVDSYSLKGFTAAINQLSENC